MSRSSVSAQRRSSETLKDILRKRSVSVTALIFPFLSLHFFNLKEVLTFKKGTSYNRAALQNTPGVPTNQNRFGNLQLKAHSRHPGSCKKESRPDRCYLQPPSKATHWHWETVYGEQSDQELGRAEEWQSQDTENVGYALQIEPTWDRRAWSSPSFPAMAVFS